MNTLSARQYTAIIILEHAILLFDICVNSFASFSRQHPKDLLVLYVVQDFCLIANLTLLLISIFSTYIFQAGLIHLLYTKFRMALVICIVYIILSISLHTWHITMHWSAPLKHYWTRGFHALYSIHRTVAVLYYCFYKRASLRISDPRFYKDTTWLQNLLNIP